MKQRGSFAFCLAVAAGILAGAWPAYPEDVVETTTQVFRGRVKRADANSVTIEMLVQGRQQEINVPRQIVKKLTVEPPPSVLTGIAAYEEGDWRKAKLNLEKIILNYQGLDVEWAQKGMVYFGRSCMFDNDHVNAEKAFDAFLKAYPDHELVVEAKLGQADVQRAKKNYEAALASFKSLAEPYEKLLRPSKEYLAYAAEIFIGIGKCLQEQGDQAGALDALLRVIALYPAEAFYPEALYRCAVAFSELNQPDKAGPRLDELIADYPASAFAKKAVELRSAIEKKKKEAEKTAT